MKTKKAKELTRKSRWIVSAVSLAVLSLIGLIGYERDPADAVSDEPSDEEAALFIG